MDQWNLFANGDVPEPFIDANDIADIAVSALLDDGHIGQIYEVTGPRLLTFREAVAEIAVSLARPVHYIDMSPDDYVSALREAQLPDESISLMSTLVKEVLDGRNAYVTDGVHRAIGRPPRDFSDFARRSLVSNDWDTGA